MARIDLGLSDAEFRSMSPGEFAVMRERLDVRERRADARAALIAKALSGADLGLEEIISILTILPDRPRVPTLAEIEQRNARALAEFNKALDS